MGGNQVTELMSS